jgi:2',3'-cyclic-nucleotide 2'-phosphodiesterase (5'-nucleotidase family)
MKQHARNRWLVLGIVLLVLTLVLPSTAMADGPDLRTVTVVSTNDLHGALVGSVQSFSHGDMVGGADWVAGYLNIVRQENPDGVLYLDAGDMMQGTLISNYFYGASTIDAFNHMGLAAMTIGNHEFDWGQEVLQERYDQADFPFLGANIFYKKKNGNPDYGHGGRPHWAKPYIVREVNGIKVGIIGIANPETPSITNPTNVANLMFTDPVQAVYNVLPEAEAEGATMIVVDAHLGGFYNSDTHSVEGEITDLACGLDPDKVDLIISGHTHSRLDDVICGIPVVQAYSSGTAFARVDFSVDAQTGEAVSYNMNSSPITTYQTYYGNPATYQRWDTGEQVEVVPDPEVQAIVNTYAEQIDALKNEVIGYTTAPLSRNSCGESVMGDWVTDIMRAYDPSIDFAFTNSGGLRVDLNAGDITFGQVFEVMPFDNTLVTATVNGEQLKKVLEEGVGPGTKYCGGTLLHGIIQVSGLKFDWDASQPLYNRVSNVRYYDDTPVDLSPTATYTIAVNDFMASGGDDYPTLPTLSQNNTYTIIRDIMVDWVKANSPFDPPALSGRIMP